MTEGDEQGFGDTGGDTEMGQKCPPWGQQGAGGAALRGGGCGDSGFGDVSPVHTVAPGARVVSPGHREHFGVLAGLLWSPQLLLQVLERRKGP